MKERKEERMEERKTERMIVLEKKETRPFRIKEREKAKSYKSDKAKTQIKLLY